MNELNHSTPRIPHDFDWNEAVARGRRAQAVAVRDAFVWSGSSLAQAWRWLVASIHRHARFEAHSDGASPQH